VNGVDALVETTGTGGNVDGPTPIPVTRNMARRSRRPPRGLNQRKLGGPGPQPRLDARPAVPPSNWTMRSRRGRSARADLEPVQGKLTGKLKSGGEDARSAMPPESLGTRTRRPIRRDPPFEQLVDDVERWNDLIGALQEIAAFHRSLRG